MEDRSLGAEDYGFEFVRSYLAQDEYVLWKGRPEQGTVLTPSDVVLIPFSLFWCGFSAMWVSAALFSGAPPFFALFGLPFVLVGLYLLFGRFIHAAYLRKNTYYVITNKSIIRKRGNKIDLLDGKNLPPMEIRLHKNGCGTISFGSDRYVYYRGRRHLAERAFTIENVSDVAAVRQVIANQFGM